MMFFMEIFLVLPTDPCKVRVTASVILLYVTEWIIISKLHSVDLFPKTYIVGRAHKIS